MVRTFYPVRIESNKVSPDLDESDKKGDHQVKEENDKRQKSKGKSKYLGRIKIFKLTSCCQTKVNLFWPFLNPQDV
jgi:hypothetical protein